MTPSKRIKRSSGDDTASPTSPRQPASFKNTPFTPPARTRKDLDAQKENIESPGHSLHSAGKGGGVADHAFLDEDDDDFVMSENTSPQQQDSKSPSNRLRGAVYAASGGYDALKSFNGQVYKGMAVGGSHTWNYQPGVWKETKIEPDLWKIDFDTIKKRAKNAPQGSGAPVGTEYHWMIVAHQYVKKVDANTYETRLSGSKYKLAHKNASSNSWSIPTVKVQRDREIELLEDAKRRVQGLPPVLASEKVKVEKREKGQQKLESMFSKASPSRSDVSEAGSAKKRKREDET